ncbi:hypothetical protein GH714_001732 [Hevea brasiliensis]|uniref:GRF-type domain-containing protein n=1 Tax=Hevea brasiliensis TaxID=3981 RepID=A0A6A6NFD5_HEVBR|nr:hypothetical protein GH714_001732 [Hevea brasiliensis]
MGVPRCTCNIEVDLCSTWAGGNLGRRFHGCRNYGTLNYCGYFQWYDDPFPLRATQVISGLLRRIDLHDLIFKLPKEKEKVDVHCTVFGTLYYGGQNVYEIRSTKCL